MESKVIRVQVGDKKQLAKLNFHKEVIEKAIKYDWNSLYFSAPDYTLAVLELNDNVYTVKTMGTVEVSIGKKIYTNKDYKIIRKFIENKKLSINNILRGNSFVITANRVINCNLVEDYTPIVLKNINTVDDFISYIEETLSYILTERKL